MIIGHPLNHDSSNAGVIRSKRTVKQCVGVKRTYNLWCGCHLFLPPAMMSDLGDKLGGKRSDFWVSVVFIRHVIRKQNVVERMIPGRP